MRVSQHLFPGETVTARCNSLLPLLHRKETCADEVSVEISVSAAPPLPALSSIEKFNFTEMAKRKGNPSLGQLLQMNLSFFHRQAEEPTIECSDT